MIRQEAASKVHTGVSMLPGFWYSQRSQIDSRSTTVRPWDDRTRFEDDTKDDCFGLEGIKTV